MGKQTYDIPKEELMFLYWEKDLTIKKIAKIYNCSLNTISLRLRKYKIKIKEIKKQDNNNLIKHNKINISKKDLKELYLEKNLSAKDIAKIYGCNNRTILIRLYNCKIKVRNKRDKFPVSRKRLNYLYNIEEYPTRKIAKILGCSKTTVENKLYKFGMSVRTKWNKIDIPKRELKKLYLDRRLSSRKIAKVYGCACTTIDRKIKGYGFETRTRAEAHRIYPRQDFSGDLIEKAYLIGFRIGDLRVRKNWENGETLQVDCGSTRLAQIRLIKKLFDPYTHVWISKPNKRGIIQIQANVNLSFSFLIEKETPMWVFNNKEHFFSFFAGFSDAEGCISVNCANQAFYSLGNYDKNILELIKENLFKYNIPCRKIVTSHIKGKTIYGNYKHNSDYYILALSKKEDLLRLLNEIQQYIKHEDKLKGLEIAKQNISERNKNAQEKLLSNINSY